MCHGSSSVVERGEVVVVGVGEGRAAATIRSQTLIAVIIYYMIIIKSLQYQDKFFFLSISGGWTCESVDLTRPTC